MVNVTVISPAVNRQGEATPSYSKNRNGDNLVHKGINRTTLSFKDVPAATMYISTHPGPAYAIERAKRSQINA